MEPRCIEVRPNNAWKLELSLDLKDVIKAGMGLLIGAAKAHITGESDHYEAAKGFADLLTAIKIKKDDAIEYRAYLLIYGAIREGLMDVFAKQGKILEAVLLKEYANRYDASKSQILVERIEEIFESETAETNPQRLKIEHWFQNRPQYLSIVSKVRQAFLEEMKESNLPDQAANHLAGEFPAAFVSKLNELLKRKPDYFQPILAFWKENVFSEEPFTAQKLYREYLQKEWSKKLPDDAVSLEDIYTDLNACYLTAQSSLQEPNEKHKKQVIVTKAEEHIKNWMLDPKPSYSLVVLKGAPGAGKSTLMKKLACDWAIQNERKVFLIPMNRIAVEESFEKTFESLQKTYPPLQSLENPLVDDNPNQKPNPIFILDGLDELSRAGDEGKQMALRLLDQLLKMLRDYNEEFDWDIRFLVTGRDLVVEHCQNHLGYALGQVLELLPYSVEGDARDWESFHFIDPQALLQIDLRAIWWQSYAQKLNRPDVAIPKRIQENEANAISVQPILCYFIARLHFSGRLTDRILGNVNLIYYQMFQDHFEREIKKGKAAKGLGLAQYLELLEVLAQTTWQNGEIRATTKTEFEKKIADAGLGGRLRAFDELSSASTENLIISFFSRMLQKVADGETLIEFTHKSLGEYLVARRFVTISKVIKESNTTPIEALENWLGLTKKEEMSGYIWAFLEREVALQFENQKALAGTIQKKLGSLFSTLINDGFPLDHISHEKTNLDIIRASRNAESSLLLTISAFARGSGEKTHLGWRDAEHPKEVLSRLFLGEVKHFGQGLAMVIFPEDVEMSKMNLSVADLSVADLSGADLSGADLSGADLSGADLSGANLSGANLSRANLRDAYLSGAYLSRANLRDAYLSGAYLSGAYLSGANLSHANLSGADLFHADLSFADLSNANLSHAKIERLRLGSTTITGQEAYDFLNRKGAMNVTQPTTPPLDTAD